MSNVMFSEITFAPMHIHLPLMRWYSSVYRPSFFTPFSVFNLYQLNNFEKACQTIGKYSPLSDAQDSR